MRLDARIAVQILCWPEAGDGPDPVPAADPQAVLLRVGDTPVPPGRDGSWADMRHLPAPSPPLGTPHPATCACCGNPRNALALLLSELYAQRAKGELGLFRRVLLLVRPAHAGMVESALRDDPFVTGRYRLVPPSGEI